MSLQQASQNVDAFLAKHPGLGDNDRDFLAAILDIAAEYEVEMTLEGALAVLALVATGVFSERTLH